MPIYVDNAQVIWQGKKWCHLVADSIDELHEFAKRLGVERRWFHRHASYPHYDVTTEMRANALKLGAVAGTRQEIITCARKLKQELAANQVQTSQLALFAE